MAFERHPEEIAELWRIHRERPTEYTLEALMALYSPLATYLAKRALAKAPAWQDRDDMFSFAHHGLLDAITKYDPDRGAKFETYATRRISGAIVDWQRRMDPLTRNERRGIKEIELAIANLANDERTPTAAEISTHTGIPEDEVRRRLVAQRSVPRSLDELLEWDSSSPEDMLGMSEHSDAETNARLNEALSHLAVTIPRLGPLERAFILVYYCENRTLRQVGALTGEHEVLSGKLKVRVLRQLMVG